MDEVEFLGYKVSEVGIQPTDDKGDKCKNGSLELLQQVSVWSCAHTRRLLDKNSSWKWTKQEAEAFRQAKQLLQPSSVLAHYSAQKPLILACDASPYGLGAVLSHVDDNGYEVPIAYGSRTTTAESNYAQTDREALAIGFGIKKFHKFIYGRHFRIVTDHKPLLGLLHHAKPMSQVLSPRMLRWPPMLYAYDYELEYRLARSLKNADALSRLPAATDTSSTDKKLGKVRMLESAPEIAWDAHSIAQCTRSDPTPARVQC